jgi:hypothetical protein
VASGADGRTGGCSAEAAVGAADIGAGPGGGAIEGRVGVLCSEGRNKAPKTSKVMLTIAAKTRLRFTPSSRRFANMMFATRTRRFYREMVRKERTAPREGSKGKSLRGDRASALVGCQRIAFLLPDPCRPGRAGILVNDNRPHPTGFFVTAHSKGVSTYRKSFRINSSKERSELRILKGLRDNIIGHGA